MYSTSYFIDISKNTRDLYLIGWCDRESKPDGIDVYWPDIKDTINAVSIIILSRIWHDIAFILLRHG